MALHMYMCVGQNKDLIRTRMRYLSTPHASPSLKVPLSTTGNPTCPQSITAMEEQIPKPQSLNRGVNAMLIAWRTAQHGSDGVLAFRRLGLPSRDVPPVPNDNHKFMQSHAPTCKK